MAAQPKAGPPGQPLTWSRRRPLLQHVRIFCRSSGSTPRRALPGPTPAWEEPPRKEGQSPAESFEEPKCQGHHPAASTKVAGRVDTPGWAKWGLKKKRLCETERVQHRDARMTRSWLGKARRRDTVHRPPRPGRLCRPQPHRLPCSPRHEQPDPVQQEQTPKILVSRGSPGLLPFLPRWRDRPGREGPRVGLRLPTIHTSQPPAQRPASTQGRQPQSQRQLWPCTAMSPATQPFNHRVKKKNKKKTCSVRSRGNPQALRSHPKSLSCLEWALRGSLNLPFHLSNLWRRQAAGPLSPCDGAVTQLSRRVQESTADHTFHRPRGAGEKTRSFTKGERPGSDRLWCTWLFKNQNYF